MPFVYFIHEDNDLSMFKIGKTECHPADRMEQLQTGNPRKLRIYRWIEVTNHGRVEEYLHTRFQDVHIRGEWFYTTAELIDEECEIIMTTDTTAKASKKWELYNDQDRLEVKLQRKAKGKYKGKKSPEEAAKQKSDYFDRKAKIKYPTQKTYVENSKGFVEAVVVFDDKAKSNLGSAHGVSG